MEKTIRALLIDDDQGDFEMTRAMVAEIEAGDISLDWVATFQEGLDALVEEAFDVYIVDYFLEDHTGLDLLLEARRRGIRAPMIMLTGRGNPSVDAEAMNAGAADYLVKGKIDPELLERSIRFSLERTLDRDELETDGEVGALEASRARFDAVFQEVDRPIVVVGPDGTILESNESFRAIYGGDASGSAPSLIDQAVPGERGGLLGLVEKLARGDMDRYEGAHAFTDGSGRVIRAVTTMRSIAGDTESSGQVVVLLKGVPG